MGKAPDLNYLREREKKLLLSLQGLDSLQLKIIHMPN